MGGAIKWKGKGTNPVYTGGYSATTKPSGGYSAGRSRSGGGMSGSTQNYMRLTSNTPTSTASPSTQRRSTAPEDIYKVFPRDTGRNDVPFQDRFRTTQADAQPNGGGYTAPYSAPAPVQQPAQRRQQTSAPTGTTRSSGSPVETLRPTPGTGPEDVAGPVTIPEKPSYLDRPELPDYTQQFQQYEAETREVQPMETMQGQMRNIMEEGNPLMDLRRSQADQAMAARGLYHSTAGVAAAERAMIDAILPIASQDAATYSNQARINQEFLQNAANMNVETFNNEIAQRANQGRQMQLMSYESDIRERLAGVDQRYAMQLETLSQEYNILGEQYKQAGTLYADTLRSMAALLGNNQLTPQQQAAGVESLVGQLEAGLQFMTGVTGGTTGGQAGGAPVSQDRSTDIENIAGISNESTLGVYPGGEMESRGEFSNAKLKGFDPLRGFIDPKAPNPEILRIDQSSGFPSLVKIGNWYYRPEGWSEQNGLATAQLLQGQNQQLYLKMNPLEQPEKQRINDRSNDWIRENPGGARVHLDQFGVGLPPALYLEMNA